MSEALLRAYAWSASTVHTLRSTASTAGGQGIQSLASVQSSSPRIAADPIGQTPPALSWIDLKDSHGVSMWNYELSIDRGGALSPGKFIWSTVADLWWGIYRMAVGITLWFLQWVLSFEWLHLISAPLQQIGISLQQVVDRVGVEITFLTITALIAGLWAIRGRYATAVWELSVALLISALATGIFAQPVQLIGGQDGYIVKANQVGQAVAGSLYTGQAQDGDPDQAGQAQVGLLVDTFIRQPTQVINFGQPIDGTKCEAAYNDVVKDGPYGGDDDIRKAMGECDEQLGDYAANPSMSMALGALAFYPAASAVMLLTLVLAGSMLVTSVWALYQSLKAIVTLVLGLLPGGGRGSVMLTAAEIIMALVSVVFVNVFLAIVLMVIQGMFAQSEGSPKTFVIADILIFVGIIVWFRQRKQMKMTARRLAEWMSQRPGARATRLPDRAGLSMGGVASGVRTAASIAQFAQFRRYRPTAGSGGMGPVYIDNRRQAAFLGGFGWEQQNEQDVDVTATVSSLRSALPAGPDRRQLTAGPSPSDGSPGSPTGPTGPGSGGPQPQPGAPSAPQPAGGGRTGRSGSGFVGRIAAVRGASALLRTGAKIAAATATGGTAPIIVAAAARAAQTARVAGKAARVASTGHGLMTGRRASVITQMNTARRAARFAARSANSSGTPGRATTSRAGQPTRARMRPATARTPGASATNSPRSPQVIFGEVLNSRSSASASTSRSGTGRRGPTPAAGGKNSTKAPRQTATSSAGSGGRPRTGRSERSQEARSVGQPRATGPARTRRTPQTPSGQPSSPPAGADSQSQSGQPRQAGNGGPAAARTQAKARRPRGV